MASGVKLADNVVQDIARLAQEGRSGRDIAKALGLSKSTVQPYVKQLRAGVGGKNGQGDARHVGAASTPSLATTAAPSAPAGRALEPHRLAALFPLMAEADYAGLKADIAANGIHEAIWLYEGKILDGRNRYRACQELGITCPTRMYDGHEPLAFILSLNLIRRHLTESQRSMVAAQIETMKRGRPGKDANLHDLGIDREKAAALLNVSTRSVAAAHKVRTEAQPEVIRAVEAGTLRVSAAAKLAEKPVDVQRTVVKELASGAAKSVDAALKHVTAATSGKAPAHASHLSRAEAEFDRRLAQMGQYFALVAQSTLVEGLGQKFADEDVGRWLQALEQLSTVTRQLAERLQKAFQERR
jgi:ParB-like chromosome segregation protein Spo0J